METKFLSDSGLLFLIQKVKDYVDEQCDKIVNGCNVSLTGQWITLGSSNVQYLKPAVITLEPDEGYGISSITVMMGDKNITSTAWDDETSSIIISKVTDDISITATTDSLLSTTLTDVVLSGAAPRFNQSWSASLTGDTGKAVLPDSVRVTMGGEDITEDAYNYENNTIQIANVTGEIGIVANGVTAYSGYTPIAHIACVTCGSHPGINLGFKATEKTKIQTDFKVTGGTREYMLTEYHVSRTAAHYCSLWVYSSKTVMGWGGTNSAGFTPAIPTSKRVSVTIDKGALAYTWEGESDTYTQNFSVSGQTFTSAQNLCIFGNRNTSASGGSRGFIYRYRHWEDDVLAHDYIPARNESTGGVGLLNLETGTFGLSIESGNIWLGPYVSSTQTLSNCAASLVSASNTGTATLAVLGASWSVKFTPSSGYTFNDANAVFSITVNEVDKTSDYATYDSATDTWTVAMVAHWNDSISITGTAQVDPNAA